MQNPISQKTQLRKLAKGDGDADFSSPRPVVIEVLMESFAQSSEPVDDDADDSRSVCETSQAHALQAILIMLPAKSETQRQ